VATLVKILLVTTIYPPDIGGPATYAWDVSRRMRARGHQVEIVSASVNAEDPDVFHPPKWFRGVRFLRGACNIAFLFWLLLRIGRRNDVFYVQSPGHVGLLVVWAARMLRKPVVLRFPGDVAWERTYARGATTKELHDFLRAPEGGWRTSMLLRIQRAVTARVDRVVTPSESVRHTLIDAYGVDATRIHAIYHSLDVEEYVAAAAATAIREDGGGPLVLSVGRLVPHKRIGDLIAAMPSVAAVFPAARLLIVGAGTERAALEAAAENLGIANRVRFLASVPRRRVLELMAEADLLVLPSLTETLSHVAIEAIAIGAPVVATAIPGLSEVLEHERTALLVPPCDPAALAAAIIRMAEDAELRERLVRNGRAAAREKFSWPANLAALEDVLLTAITARSA
jgi:glycosyltransferase involved in cell wall biosynthesis